MYRFQVAGKISLHFYGKGNLGTFTGRAGLVKTAVVWRLENRSRSGRKLSRVAAVRGQTTKWRPLQSYPSSTEKYVTLLISPSADPYNCASSLRFGGKKRLLCRQRSSPISCCRMLAMKASELLSSLRSDISYVFFSSNTP